MSNSLRKKVVKQQSRLAALDLLGTPVGSEAESETESESSSVLGDSVLPDVDSSVLEDDIRHCVDELGEKRASSRESALTNLSKVMRHYYCGSFFDSHSSAQEALLQLLLRLMRKPGTPEEAVLATRVIGLVFVNAGEQSESEQESLYAMVIPYLKDVIKDSTHVELKCQAIDTLATVTFAAASTSSTKGALDYLYKILISNANNVQPDEAELSTQDVLLVLESTLHAYGLLYASVFGEQRGNIDDAWDEWQSAMPAHLDLLESKSKDVRVAAGENVALMYECSHVQKKNDLLEEDAQEVEENDMSEYEELDDLIDILQRLANESSRRVNKQDRKEQKSAFRDILKSIQTGSRPKEKLKLGRQKFIFRGWAQILELHAFRSILGAGLANHFESNELVQDVFSGGLQDDDSEEEQISMDSGMDDEDDELSSVRSRKNANRAKHAKKYKDAYEY
ncbi:Interferon- developmental regulator 1 [Rhizopus stolonifer]|uniref:Interferon-developmental regulator 1 n=1 Tax=Rhizopus stolonifer TaxID=4846 RepID=A0A367JAM5_RHIST|nr:Interferon- developmental regulator 1 [Rhizopus stolonifer]